MWTCALPIGPGSVRKSGRNLGNPLVEKSALAVAGTPSAVGACWRISGGVMHHESACKSEFRVRFPEWGQASLAQTVERPTLDRKVVGSIPTGGIVLVPGRKIMDTFKARLV